MIINIATGKSNWLLTIIWLPQENLSIVSVYHTKTISYWMIGRKHDIYGRNEWKLKNFYINDKSECYKW